MRNNLGLTLPPFRVIIQSQPERRWSIVDDPRSYTKYSEIMRLFVFLRVALRPFDYTQGRQAQGRLRGFSTGVLGSSPGQPEITLVQRLGLGLPAGRARGQALVAATRHLVE